MFKRIAVVLALGCLFFALGAFAKPQVVVTRDGREIVGEVTRLGDAYQIQMKTTAGLATVSVPADQVVSVKDYVDPKSEYEERLAKIDPNSARDHLDLGRWAYDKELYEIARKECEAALKINKDLETASLVLRLVEAKLRQPPPTGTTKPGTTGESGIQPEWLLSDDDISHIRLEELKRSDVVQVQFRNRLLDRFLEGMKGKGAFADDPQAKDKFMALSPMRKMLFILENTDRDDSATKDDIVIKSDPRFMVTFRDRVWPIVSRSCGSLNCHGGAKGEGGFKVFNISGKNEKVDYTNYVLIDGFVDKDGRRMLSRDDPESSLLLQYSLPANLAQVRHSTKIDPVFNSRDAVGYKAIYDWIDSLAKPRHPNYRLHYKPPFGLKLDLSGGPTFQLDTRPATKPAAGADKGP